MIFLIQENRYQLIMTWIELLKLLLWSFDISISRSFSVIKWRKMILIRILTRQLKLKLWRDTATQIYLQNITIFSTKINRNDQNIVGCLQLCNRQYKLLWITFQRKDDWKEELWQILKNRVFVYHWIHHQIIFKSTDIWCL